MEKKKNHNISYRKVVAGVDLYSMAMIGLDRGFLSGAFVWAGGGLCL